MAKSNKPIDDLLDVILSVCGQKIVTLAYHGHEGHASFDIDIVEMAKKCGFQGRSCMAYSLETVHGNRFPKHKCSLHIAPN